MAVDNRSLTIVTGADTGMVGGGLRVLKHPPKFINCELALEFKLSNSIIQQLRLLMKLKI